MTHLDNIRVAHGEENIITQDEGKGWFQTAFIVSLNGL